MYHHHHILSRQYWMNCFAASLQSWRSSSVQRGPASHSCIMWSIVCDGFPHWHSLVEVSPHLRRLLPVLPTLDLARLRVTHSFLGRSAPHGRFSTGPWIALFGERLSQSLHLSSRSLADSLGSKLSDVKKLFRDLSLLFTSLWQYKECLGSFSCLYF